MSGGRRKEARMSDYQTIIVEEKEGVGFLTLNRPKVRNAINQEMIDEIRHALRLIDGNPAIRVLIITGAGAVFQAGADIAELKRMTPLGLLRWNEGIVRINANIERLRQPVIAAINGAALGGGLEIALACTLRVAARSAKLGLPEVKLGIIPGTGGTQRLPRLIGKGRAAELLLTGDTISAEVAYRIGILNQVAEDGQAVATALSLAARIMVNAPVAVEMTKNAMEVGMELPLEQAVQYSQKNCAICFSTQDMQEGTAAFMEKRTPTFIGK